MGRKLNENTEEILAMQPDLVVVSSATSKAFVDQLDSLGVKVYVARSPHNYKEMCAKIIGIAACCR